MKKETGLGALILFLNPLQTSRGPPIIVFNREKESKKKMAGICVFHYLVYTYRHQRQRSQEHEGLTGGNHLREQLIRDPEDIARSFKISTLLF